MALDKNTLKVNIKEAFKSQTAKKNNQEDALEDLADKIASAMDAYIKTATVSTTVIGACATPSGAGTINGTGAGTIS